MKLRNTNEGDEMTSKGDGEWGESSESSQRLGE